MIKLDNIKFIKRLIFLVIGIFLVLESHNIINIFQNNLNEYLLNNFLYYIFYFIIFLLILVINYLYFKFKNKSIFNKFPSILILISEVSIILFSFIFAAFYITFFGAFYKFEIIEFFGGAMFIFNFLLYDYLKVKLK